MSRSIPSHSFTHVWLMVNEIDVLPLLLPQARYLLTGLLESGESSPQW